MTPTPPAGATGQGAGSLWIVAVVFSVLGLMLVVGLATGVIRLSPERVRRSGGRTAVSLDAALAPRDRREALEYLLDDHHRVVMEQERGEGDPDGAQPPVLYQYPDEADRESPAAD